MRLFKFALLTSVAAMAFDPNGTWKKDENGNLVVDANGNPIIIANGTEQSVKGDTIARTMGEARDNRIRAEKAEEALKVFEGLDPAAAKDAMEKLKKIDDKTLIDAGEVDRVRQEIQQGFTGQLAEKDTTISTLQQQVNNMLIDGAFSSSQFIADRVAVPGEMFKAVIGKNFKVEDGKVVPYDLSGNKVFSKKNYGELADLNEAFEIIVEGYPHKDQILRAPNASGAGGGGQGGQRGGNKQMRRSEFNALPIAEQARAAQAASKGEITIVD